MRRFIPLLIPYVVLFSMGCGDGGSLVVNEAWAQTSPSAADNGAFYFTIDNQTGHDRALVDVQIEVCEVIELHEMSIDDAGVMHMGQLPNNRLPIPAGKTVELAPGGLHVMCLGKTAAFSPHEHFSLTLIFDNGKEIEVSAVSTNPVAHQDHQ